MDTRHALASLAPSLVRQVVAEQGRTLHGDGCDMRLIGLHERSAKIETTARP